MQCHRCKWDARNGGTLEDRGRHCIDCEFSEVFSKPAFPIGTSLTDALIEKESMSNYEHDRLEDEDADKTPNDTDAEMAIMSSSEFVKRFPKLGWREQQIVLHILNSQGDNRAIHESTRMAVSTIIQHRRKLEADSYWGKWLDRLSARQRSRRKRTMKPPAAKTHDCNGAFHKRRGAG